MSTRAEALVLRRRARQVRALQVRLDAACERIRRLADANVRLRETSTGLVRLLAIVAEGADPDRPGHGERTARLATRLARRLDVPACELDDLRVAAQLHDVGRTAAEEDRAGHAERAARLLEALPFGPAVAATIRSHHDRFDGRGNRTGLRGEEIPLLARILSVADAFDELTDPTAAHVLSATEAARTLRGTAGRIHDPAVVEALSVMLCEDDERRLRENDAELAGATT